MQKTETEARCRTSHGCGSSEGENPGALESDTEARLDRIRRKIMVLSGKGGVGKSTVAVHLAMRLSRAGHKVGLLDVDIHGPSVPMLLGLEGRTVASEAGKLLPLGFQRLEVMSIGFFLPNRDDAVIWRGPKKMGLIRQFLTDVAWGDLDYLVVDCPPGTGDEPLSVVQILENADGAVILTTPQELALSDVRKSISFCREVGLPVIGVVENMSGFACPGCGEVSEIFGRGGGEDMARDMAVPFLGSIPIDPLLVTAGDEGKPYVSVRSETPAALALEGIVTRIREFVGKPGETRSPEAWIRADTAPAPEEARVGKGDTLKIALPVSNNELCPHFGHCETFALFEVDEAKKEILGTEFLDAPPHEPGLLPRWLSEKGANLVIAGGMGMRAQQFFSEYGIRVIVGVAPTSPGQVVTGYLNGTLVSGENICDH